MSKSWEGNWLIVYWQNIIPHRYQVQVWDEIGHEALLSPFICYPNEVLPAKVPLEDVCDVGFDIKLLELFRNNRIFTLNDNEWRW